MTATEEETGSSEGDFYFLHHQYAAPSEGVGATDGRADGGKERRRHKATFKSHLLLTVCAARSLVKPERDRERKRGGLSRTNERTQCSVLPRGGTQPPSPPRPPRGLSSECSLRFSPQCTTVDSLPLMTAIVFSFHPLPSLLRSICKELNPSWGK